MNRVLLLAALAGGWGMGFGSALGPLRLGGPTSAPAIVFVSRRPPAGGRGIPGLGPSQRATATGGRLMVRSAAGRVYELVPRGRFFDVADPAVSWDGRRVVFAATAAPDSAWRLWIVGADGRGLAPVTRSDRSVPLDRLGPGRARFERYDDFDPAWLPDGRIVFASTRYPQLAEHGGRLASNLFVVEAQGGALTRITAERNGAEEPCVDPRTGRIVFARWWTSGHFASDRDAAGFTTDRARAVPAPEVDLWQAVSITPDGGFARLAGGFPLDRARMMAYQPLVLEDGTLVGVTAEHTSLDPDPGAVSVYAFSGGFGEPVPVPRPDRNGRPVIACAPASLGGRRIVLACDVKGTGDFGLEVASLDGGSLAPLVDLPGTDELDPAMLAPRRRPPVIPARASGLPNELPPADAAGYLDRGETFRFDCLNVFANAAVDVPIPDAPPIQTGLRIRFFAALARPGVSSGDTVVMIRETPLLGGGAVHEDGLPGDTPMFEQLVDAHGHVVRSVSGPAHVPGFNANRVGSGTKCVGCHLGHSTIPVARSDFEGKRFNAAPSARATATSTAPGSAGPGAAIDRRTLGPDADVGWISDTAGDQTLRLDWSTAIEVDSLILYALRVQPASGTSLEVRECTLAFFKDGRQVSQQQVRTVLSPQGTRVACGGVRADALEFRPTRYRGTVLGRERVGIAEIATVARLAEY